MKRFLSTLLIIAWMLALCACGSEIAPTTTSAPPPTTAATEPGCIHIYQNADCVSAKTCTLCGAERGSALGHDYAEGICTRCGLEDLTYVPLLDGDWRTEALSDTGSQIESISLRFAGDGTATLSAGIYNRLSDIPEAEREDYMLCEENWYDYSGEIYYYAGFGVSDIVHYIVEGNVITCTLGTDEEIAGTLILERTGGNMLTVTYFEGTFSIVYLQVGDVLSVQT